ncbi:MAG: TonB-dependent receptor, partial [Bacteroidota bacterium]
HATLFSVNGQTYQNLQPRVGLRYLLNNDIALKASYTQMVQYINLLTNESLSLPTDLWVPSTERVRPHDAWQTAIGVATTVFDQYELSIEGYYKQMRNVISYREGASFIGIENDWQDRVTQGNGEAYGVELFFQKKKGRTTGWLGYTLSWNWRQFDEINSGERFPFKYDRRHDVSLVLSYDFNERISLTGSWIYGTGNSITLPLYRYTLFSQIDIENIGRKNAFRMKPYHRMDLNLSIANKKRKFKKWQSTFNIGAYNVYNRNNPYFVTTGLTASGERTFRQISLFPIVPSLSYQFSF